MFVWNQSSKIAAPTRPPVNACLFLNASQYLSTLIWIRSFEILKRGDQRI